MEETARSTPEGKLEHLRAVAKTANEIASLLRVGVPIARLREYAERHQGIVLQEKPGEIVCQLDDHVDWHITVDEKGEIAGYLFSGFEDLMAELGIDFGGNPFARE